MLELPGGPPTPRAPHRPGESAHGEQPALAACLMAAAAGRALLGPHKPPLRVVAAAARSPARSRALCAVARGVDIHASAAVPARDRKRLERLCRTLRAHRSPRNV